MAGSEYEKAVEIAARAAHIVDANRDIWSDGWLDLEDFQRDRAREEMRGAFAALRAAGITEIPKSGEA
jgi:hypothetical protein